MGSKILPQALVVISRNPTHCPFPKKLRFSSTLHRCSSLSGPNLEAIISAFARRRFFARAESENSEGGEVAEESENGGVVKEIEEQEEKEGKVILNKRGVEASEKERPIPDIRTGNVVEIKLEVPENRRRLSIYKGIVMSRQNAGTHTTIRVRRIIAGIGVEIVFPL
ncbi:hypothetical protein P3X46_029786 [Hevea brasiliensis]|uniref:Uncharacterized protein n=1 Tax=Hevea brasiliensis TaxID=3981 RepID=A0ABQ9KV12_HEVBR|nr:hypothetical protein P3X46_029786 [Hevea brasiliensis]